MKLSLAWLLASLGLAGVAWAITPPDLQIMVSCSTMLWLPIPVLVSSRAMSRGVLMAGVGLLTLLMQAFLELECGLPRGSFTPVMLILLVALANALCVGPYNLATWLIQLIFVGSMGWLYQLRHYPTLVHPLAAWAGAAVLFVLSSLPGRKKTSPEMSTADLMGSDSDRMRIMPPSVSSPMPSTATSPTGRRAKAKSPGNRRPASMGEQPFQDHQITSTRTDFKCFALLVAAGRALGP